MIKCIIVKYVLVKVCDKMLACFKCVNDRTDLVSQGMAEGQSAVHVIMMNPRVNKSTFSHVTQFVVH